MRIVAGSARGRRIEAPPGRETRPTSDRVREAVFNALGSLGAVDDARVIDLFAGSGALGLEALSRGAAHAVFVERDRRTAELVSRNVAGLGFGDRAEVVLADAEQWIERAPEADLLLCDPPYAFEGWPGLIERSPSPLVVAESDREIEAPSGWHVVRSKAYGTTVVTILARAAPIQTPPPETSE